MKRVMLRISVIQLSGESGSILLACSLVMFGVVLLSSAALRSLEDRISLTHNAVDRRLAQQAAEAALHDAARTLAMMPEQLTLAEVQGAHRIGELTGETYAYGGYLQPCALPEYVLQLISPSDITNIYRVTAYGKGHNDSTTVTLQAEFAVQICKNDSDGLQNTTPELAQDTERNTPESALKEAGQSPGRSEVPSTGEGAEIKRAACVPGVRRLAWRLLQAT